MHDSTHLVPAVVPHGLHDALPLLPQALPHRPGLAPAALLPLPLALPFAAAPAPAQPFQPALRTRQTERETDDGTCVLPEMRGEALPGGASRDGCG
jgi:hypothetical protein